MNRVLQSILAGVVASIVILAVVYTAYIHNAYQKLQECQEEAQVWYDAFTAQGDAYYNWLAKGQKSGELNLDVVTIFIAKAHELSCIEPKYPPA